MTFFIFFIYRPVYFILKIFLKLLKPLLNTKLQGWVNLRDQSVMDFKKSGRPIFLFHASSGEIEYVKSMIRELKELQVEVDIFVTYSSPSALKLFDNIKPFVDLFTALPWDQPSSLARFLDKIQPHSVFFARTDLWPEFLFQLRKRSVKTYIISYNPNLGFLNQIWIKYFLSGVQALFCVHSRQSEVLKTLLPETVFVSAPGDTRFDQVFWRLRQESRIPFSLPSKYAVFGSTWPEDETQFFPSLKMFLDSGNKMVWSPHEIQPLNISRILLLLDAEKIPSIKLTDLLDKELSQCPEFQVILVDQIGYLADFYRFADWAFVGGSFKAKVHSVMEPLCCAIPVITGPFIFNSPEALKYSRISMNGLPVVQVVQNSDEFSRAVEKIKSIQSSEFKKLLIGNLEQNRNATKKILQLIVRWTRESLSS